MDDTFGNIVAFVGGFGVASVFVVMVNILSNTNNYKKSQHSLSELDVDERVLEDKQYQISLNIMLLLIKPILFSFLKSRGVRQLVVDLLEAYAKSTDNTIDDAAVELVKKNIFPTA